MSSNPSSSTKLADPKKDETFAASSSTETSMSLHGLLQYQGGSNRSKPNARTPTLRKRLSALKSSDLGVGWANVLVSLLLLCIVTNLEFTVVYKWSSGEQQNVPSLVGIPSWTEHFLGQAQDVFFDPFHVLHQPTTNDADQDAVLRKSLLSYRERAALLKFEPDLGVDPSSEHFTKRTKSIAFMIKLDGQWFQLNQNFFNQNADYNDFSGGYKRFYDTLPPEFVREPATIKLMDAFQAKYNLPDGELILLQMQTSWVFPGDEDRCLTGQGIHTDGADRAMLVVLNRDNIEGGRNAIYKDVHGQNAVIKPFVLKEGDSLFWKDNQVFHHVEPAQVKDTSNVEGPSGTRTVIIAHYPAMHYITGHQNWNNRLVYEQESMVGNTTDDDEFVGVVTKALESFYSWTKAF